MYLTGYVRKLKSGDYLCFVGNREHLAVEICKLTSKYRQYLTAKDGYILFVREFPKPTGGYKRYYYKIPVNYLHFVGKRGSIKVFKINTMFVYDPETLYRVEDVAPTGQKTVEYQREGFLSSLLHKAENFFGSLLHRKKGKTKNVNANATMAMSVPPPPSPPPQTEPSKSQKRGNQPKISVEIKPQPNTITSYLPIMLIPLVAVLLVSKR